MHIGVSRLHKQLLKCSAASMPLTKHLNVAIIDSNPALLARDNIKKEDAPDPRVSTVTPATISFFKGTTFEFFFPFFFFAVLADSILVRVSYSAVWSFYN